MKKKSTELTSKEFMISASLADSPKHGYAIAKDIENDTSGEVKFSASTLYSSLSRMSDSGLVSMNSMEESGRLRKVYRLTNSGPIQHTNSYLLSLDILVLIFPHPISIIPIRK